jgi:hypothetical protein
VVIGGKEILVNPSMSVTDLSAFAISRWEPSVALSNLKAAFMVMDNANSGLEYQLLVRTCNDPSEPNAWVTAEASWANPSAGNSARNTGELSIPAGANLSSNHLIQLGVGVRKTGSSNPRATLRVVSALKYS